VFGDQIDSRRKIACGDVFGKEEGNLVVSFGRVRWHPWSVARQDFPFCCSRIMSINASSRLSE